VNDSQISLADFKSEQINDTGMAKRKEDAIQDPYISLSDSESEQMNNISKWEGKEKTTYGSDISLSDSDSEQEKEAVELYFSQSGAAISPFKEEAAVSDVPGTSSFQNLKLFLTRVKRTQNQRWLLFRMVYTIFPKRPFLLMLPRGLTRRWDLRKSSVARCRRRGLHQGFIPGPSHRLRMLSISSWSRLSRGRR